MTILAIFIILGIIPYSQLALLDPYPESCERHPSPLTLSPVHFVLDQNADFDPFFDDDDYVDEDDDELPHMGS